MINQQWATDSAELIYESRHLSLSLSSLCDSLLSLHDPPPPFVHKSFYSKKTTQAFRTLARRFWPRLLATRGLRKAPRRTAVRCRKDVLVQSSSWRLSMRPGCLAKMRPKCANALRQRPTSKGALATSSANKRTRHTTGTNFCDRILASMATEVVSTGIGGTGYVTRTFKAGGK